MSTRSAAVAGTFYPADRNQLQDDVTTLLATDSVTSSKKYTSNCPKALILPHAGYIYSGAVAAEGYRLLSDYSDSINKVVILGPSHRVAFSGIALPTDEYFFTPLGKISVDLDAAGQLQDLPFVFQSDHAHQYEHSVEVHLPFLQKILNKFTIVPLVVGDTSASEVAMVINTYFGLKDVLIIVSTDLSHFLSYQQATDTDRQTSVLICENNNNIRGEQACGSRPLNGLLTVAGQQHLQVEELALCNSGDTAGDKSRVVGYGAYVIY